MAIATDKKTALRFLDGGATILKSRSEGETPVSLVEISMPQGAMSLLHAQDEDETVHVLDGRVTFYVGDDVVSAEAGHGLVVPKAVAHTYRVDSKGGATWVVATAAGRFEAFVRAVGRPAEQLGVRGPRAIDLAEAVAFTAGAAQNGIEILGPAGTLPGRKPVRPRAAQRRPPTRLTFAGRRAAVRAAFAPACVLA